MQTRRQLLQHAVVAPFVVPAGAVVTGEIISEGDCLSQESACGFSLVRELPRRLIILCAAGARAAVRVHELRERAIKGAWVVWEHRPENPAVVERALSAFFGVHVQRPQQPEMYIEYLRPQRILTRSFVQATPAACPGSEVIARHNGAAVCLRRCIGRGGIIFLGSMLGPNLYAEEPQAHAIASGLFGLTGV